MVTLKQTFSAWSQMFENFNCKFYMWCEMSVVSRSWVVRLLSAFIVSAKETTLFAHNVLQSTIKLKVGIAPTFGAL